MELMVTLVPLAHRVNRVLLAPQVLVVQRVPSGSSGKLVRMAQREIRGSLELKASLDYWEIPD